MNFDKLDETNFLLYAAKYYDNPHCHDIEEFNDDLKRFKYIKRLFSKYEETDEIRERLILNHILILYNVFGDHATRMLFYKMNGYYHYLKPFLVLINRMPTKIFIECGNIIDSNDIPMDPTLVSILRTI